MKRIITFIILMSVGAAAAFAGMELQSAKIYKKQGEIAKAIEFYDQAVGKEPDNAEALFERGELLGMIAMDNVHTGLRKKLAGESTDAQRSVLERAIADFKGVRELSASGDKKAKKYESKMQDIIERYWWEFYSKAVAADSSYRAMEEANSMENATVVVEQGLKAAETAIMIDPEHWSSRFVYAQLKGFQERDESFVKAWEEAGTALENSDLKTKEPENYKNNRYYVQLQLIQHYYSSQDYLKTIEMADRMLTEDPGSVEAVQYKAFSLATMANDEDRPQAERDSLKRVALKALNDAKVSNPDDENIIFYIGQFNLQLADTSAALTAFDEFLTKSPSDRDVLFTQGLIYLEGEKYGDLGKAADKFKAITESSPEDGPAWINYGIALIRQGKSEEGARAIEKGDSLSKGQ